MSKKFKYVGSTFPCDDAVRKVTGDLAYGSDMRLPNMLHAKLLLSSIPHGIVKNIDTSKAEKVPGVIRIFHTLMRLIRCSAVIELFPVRR